MHVSLFGFALRRSEDDVWFGKGWREGAVSGTVVAVGVLGLAGAALAANPVKGATDSGALVAPRSSYKVSFEVSGNGGQISGLTISNLPFYCPGGGGAIPVKFADAPISKSGTFTSTGKYITLEGPLKGQLATKLTITGTFGQGGSEAGTVTSTWVKLHSCSGQSSYTAKS
jgi:hypothetical protein